MNIHLPAILMFTRGTRFWHTAIFIYIYIHYIQHTHNESSSIGTMENSLRLHEGLMPSSPGRFGLASFISTGPKHAWYTPMSGQFNGTMCRKLSEKTQLGILPLLSRPCTTLLDPMCLKKEWNVYPCKHQPNWKRTRKQSFSLFMVSWTLPNHCGCDIPRTACTTSCL